MNHYVEAVNVNEAFFLTLTKLKILLIFLNRFHNKSVIPGFSIDIGHNESNNGSLWKCKSIYSNLIENYILII